MTQRDLTDRLVGAIGAEPRIHSRTPPADWKPGDRLSADLGLDSVGMLYLVLAIEDAFGVEVDDAEALSEHFGTWGEVLAYVEGLLA